MSSNTGILTKEEILGKHTGEHGIYLTKGQICGSDALDAMDEYAQQQERVRSIAFAEWFFSDENSYKEVYHSDDDNDGMWYDSFSEGINRHYYTTEQLYELYLKQTNQ